jgi:hypothetical protein
MWTKLQPNIQIEETRRLYYGKYLYKIRLQLACARAILLSPDLPIQESVQRLSANRWYNPHGSWKSKLSLPSKEEIVCLAFLRDLKKSNKNIKIRIESDNVDLYSTTEDQLYKIINEHEHLKDFLIGVSLPDEKHRDTLLSGKQLVKGTVKYRYKVILRDGTYTAAELNSIHDYLEGCGDLVKVTKGCKQQLIKDTNRSNGWLWSCYFYTNDIKICTFVQIINPRVIRNYYELVEYQQ